ncbi:response regulator [bacterium]|nr:MAG: response regulator [bacterium]
MSHKVLLVDDEAAVRDLFNDLLKKEKYSVKCIATGEEALELIKNENFDVVLLDIKLTGMNGVEVLQKIKEIKPDTVVIMITGFGYDEDLIAKTREFGCSGYLGKNMPISQIMSNFKLFIKTVEDKKIGKQLKPGL